MTTVVLIGTLDTKGLEYDFMRRQIKKAGVDVLLVDAGVLGRPRVPPDVTREQVAQAAGADLVALAAAGDRGAAVMAMARGAAAVAQQLHSQHQLDGVMGLGGSGNSSIAAAAMQALPIGVPKLIVSTLASGDTRPYVGTSDVTMMYSVVDIAGINRLSERILSNAAAAVAGMARSYAARKRRTSGKPLIGATMFGVTTPCVNEARAWLEKQGYEVLVFHATGTGGRSMEALVRGGFLAGVLDVTTTELADELVGGVLSAGPDRLEAAGALGLPQVVSLGALDMVNFGPIDTVPEKFRGRNLYKHNATVTLMRTTPGENAELGRMIARKLNAAQGPVTIFVPKRGVSMIDVEGKPFYDPAADAALTGEVKANVRKGIAVKEMDTDINDPRFAQAMARELNRMILSRKNTKGAKTG
jgi:uncharacterized protein (UPF0261 family)